MFEHKDISRKPIRIDTVFRSGSHTSPRSFDVARFDEVHPVISGNKYYKLRYNLEEAIKLGKKGIVTMGGAFSNHLAATAFACREAGLLSAAFLRGELVEPLNSTLSFCKQQGMQLIPTARCAFNQYHSWIRETLQSYPDYYFVPEGGANEWGIKGASEMLSQVTDMHSYTHIIAATGTATTIAGIAADSLPHQQITGIPVIRIEESRQAAYRDELHTSAGKNIQLHFDHAGKGYAKTEPALFEFMNQFYRETEIPTDFVYTGKLMRAVVTLLQQGAFPDDSKLLVIHSGGLQGNQSLPEGTLIF